MPRTGTAVATSDDPETDALLRSIFRERRLTILFQPIVAMCAGGVHGYEALARGPEDTGLHAPLPLFEAARRAGWLMQLELLCREMAIEQFGRPGLPGKLFLNVSPEPRARGPSTPPMAAAAYCRLRGSSTGLRSA